jgi:hydrogenase maturation protein HypF
LVEPNSEKCSVTLRVRGVVQGVGFRPFIYRLARRYGLSGWVLNDVEGVLIEATGPERALAAFTRAIRDEAPPAARVDAVEELERRTGAELNGFTIRKSERSEDITTLISPDLSICADCLRELFDPDDPRHLYPYINCTNCGPRYSIITALPYDRPHTTMEAYPLCQDCAREYGDPLNRRFHAQPVACPNCGPSYRYLDTAGRLLASENAAVTQAAQDLCGGLILAVKGLGGYHLVCDATDAAALRSLRERKFRKEKPFALMAKDLVAAERVVTLEPGAREALESSARPIVLLAKEGSSLPDELAPENAELGVMLPYTPLHHLLFAAGAPPLLVMTSANRSSEPIAYRDEDALERLHGIADTFLVGERPIARRIDDSVVRIMDGSPVTFRRARGYAPAPVLFSARLRGPLLGLGGGLKNAITLATGGYAFVSQHVGDLDNFDAFEAFRETVSDLTTMYGVELEHATFVHDLHPDYPSSRFAETLPGEKHAVQHHKAHIASVLAEQDAWETPVLGFSFDGAGLGEDGTVWGGEVFHGSLEQGFRRVAHLRQAYLPGGDAAARNPQQAAVGFLTELDESAWRPYLPEKLTRLAKGLIQSGLNSPKTSSIGRLFDTVAALTGFERSTTFEGQAAMALEALALSATGDRGSYHLPFDGHTWDYRPLLEQLLADRRKGEPAPVMARRFHQALAGAVVQAAQQLSGHHAVAAVALSGGVWQNKLLHQLTLEALRQHGFTVWWNHSVPPGDGGLSLGQVALVGERK